MTYCQSCGMPMTEPVHFGTEGDGNPSQDYCTYCYQKGTFTAPNITMEEMIAVCTPHMVQAGYSEETSRTMMQEMFPKLKRWSK